MADSTSDRTWLRAGKVWVLPSVALPNGLNVAGPPLLFGLRLWASVCLALYVAFWLELDLPSWAGGSAAIVCQPRLGASLRKGWFRMIGTLIGAALIVLLTACFPQDRAGFLLGLALWCAACAFVATILKNFAAYSAALAGYTAAIVASNTLGATGGPDAGVFMLAINRATEICVGIVCAGIVLAGTDFGGARRRLAALLAALAVDIARQFTAMLAGPKSGLPETQAVRRELIRRVVALDPVIDETIGESATLRFHSRCFSRQWTACSPPWPAGARSRHISSGCQMIRLGRRRKPSCGAPQSSSVRLSNRRDRRSGWKSRSVGVESVRRRLKASSPCRRARRPDG